MSLPTPQVDRVTVTLGLRTGRRRAIGLALLGLALASGAVALVLFPQAGQTQYGWPFYMGSLILFVAVVDTLFAPPEEDTRSGAVTRLVALSGLAILFLAATMRFYRLGTLPFGTWWDEADIGLKAIQILRDPGYRPEYLEFHGNALHFPYLVASAIRLLGASTASVRVVSAIFGLATVGLAFFVGREAHGTRFGLFLATFTAVARWHVTFSRLGMSTVTSPFFILLTVLFLLRAKRTNHVRDLAGAGLALGLGLCFHTSFRLFPLVVVGFLTYWGATRWSSRRRAAGQRAVLVASLAIFALGAGLAAAPVAQYAIREPDGFVSRARTVSIFQNRDEPDLGQAITSNTIKHLLMFNYEGDRNGRHNLPGAPLLDPVTGVLFVLGLGLALSRLRDPGNALFVALFVTGLSAAILSVDFEAPQAQRAAGAMPAVFYFAALAVEALWRSLERARPDPLVHRAGVALLLAAGALVVYLNAETYFIRQANHAGAWEAHSAAETLTAHRMRELDPEETTFYVSPLLHNSRVIQFLAPKVRDSRVLVPSQALPLREPGDRLVELLFGREQARIAEEVRRLYPNAEQSVARNPEGDPVLYTVVVPAEEIRAIQGLAARYWQGHTTEGDPALSRTEKTLDHDWPGTAPVEPPFVADWDGILYVPEYGEYELSLQSPGAATVWLDLLPLLSSEGAGEQRARLSLPQGNHRLHVRAASGEGKLRLAWRRKDAKPFEPIPAWALYQRPRVESQGLMGTYYHGAGWQGPPALMRIDPVVDTYFHLTPLERPYSVDWTGGIEVPTGGEYAFGLRVRGQAQLFVDGQLVVDAPGPADYVEGKVDLAAGRHGLRLQFLDHLENSRLHLYWTPPGAQREVIPREALVPFGHAIGR